MAGWPCIFRNRRLVLSVWHLPSCGFDATSPFPLDAVLFKTLQSFTSLMLISSSAMSPKGESPRTAVNDTFQNKQCTIREVFKWLSKVIIITRLRLLRFVIGWKNFSTNDKQNQTPITHCTRDFSRILSKLQVIARNSDWFDSLRCLLVAVIFQQSYGNH